MRTRTALYVIALGIVGLLVLANWTTLALPTEFNLLVARIEAPLVVLVLLIVGTMLLIDLLVHAVSRRSWTRERRDLSHEIDRLRVRADEADEFRIARLRETLERETATIRGQLDRLIANQSSTEPAARAGDGGTSGDRRQDPFVDQRSS